MTVVLKASTSADFLAMVPALLHFTPHDSVVLVAFRGTRTCGAMRVDLPPAAESTAVKKRFVTTAVGMICKIRQVDSVAIVVFTDDKFEAGSVVPHAELASILARRLEQSGFGLRESLCQASDGWASYLDAEVPAGGHPLTDIASSTITEGIPADLRVDPSAPPPPLRVADADEPTRDRVRSQLSRLRELMDAWVEEDPEGTGEEPRELLPLADLPLFAERALGWSDEDVDDNDALMILALQGPPMRDATMLQWATRLEVGCLSLGENDAMLGVTSLSDLPGAHQLLSDLMLGIGPRPDVERVERGIDLLLTLVSRADDAERPPMLCMLTWLNWGLGRGSAAGRYLDEAIAIRPDYGMAEVLGTILHNGIMPEWAFQERSG